MDKFPLTAEMVSVQLVVYEANDMFFPFPESKRLDRSSVLMALLEGGESDEGKDSPPVSSSRRVDVPCEARWMRFRCKSLPVRCGTQNPLGR